MCKKYCIGIPILLLVIIVSVVPYTIAYTEHSMEEEKVITTAMGWFEGFFRKEFPKLYNYIVENNLLRIHIPNIEPYPGYIEVSLSRKPLIVRV